MTSDSRLVNIASVVLLAFAISLFVVAILTLSLVIYNEVATVRHENIIRTKLSMQSVVAVIEEYKRETGVYPKALSELTGIYLAKVPVDIWNNPYQYEYLEEENSYRLYTLGEGGELGGDKDQTDYDNNTNWDLVY